LGPVIKLPITMPLKQRRPTSKGWAVRSPIKAFLISLVILASTGLRAQDFIFCVDVPVNLGGTTYLPNQVIRYSGGTYSLYANSPPGLPAGAHIDALALRSDGSLLFSTDAPFSDGSTTYIPADVIQYSAGVLSIYRAGSMFSEGANVDAIGLASNGDLLLSLDAAEQVGPTLFQPEDVVRVTMAVTIFFDGSSNGIPAGANVTGFDRNGSDIYLNFDAPVSLGGTVYNPWDIVRYSGGTYSLYFREPAFPPSGAITDFHFLCSAPVMTGNNSAADPDTCADGGVAVSWPQDPDSWGDGGSGTRTYTVLRDAVPIQAGIAYATTTCTDAAGVNNTTYTYTVKYNNGCGASVTTAGAAAADWAGSPGEIGGGSGAGNILEWTSETDIRWPSDPLAATYTLYRGTRSQLPALLSGTDDSCTRYSGSSLSLSSVTEVNAAAGDFYWYIVTGTNGGGCQGPAGSATAGQRVVNSTGPCI
jgi:hypothetical protein